MNEESNEVDIKNTKKENRETKCKQCSRKLGGHNREKEKEKNNE